MNRLRELLSKVEWMEVIQTIVIAIMALAGIVLIMSLDEVLK